MALSSSLAKSQRMVVKLCSSVAAGVVLCVLAAFRKSLRWLIF